jgi:DNA-binding NarL/FixJ family response regulator
VRDRRAPDARRGHDVIRVVLVDDQTLVRAGFLGLLDAEDDATVVGEAADGERRWRPSAANGPR